MYVCVCKQITDKQIIDALENGAQNVIELQEQLGVATDCGSCIDCINELVCEYSEHSIPIENIKIINSANSKSNQRFW